MEPRRLQSLDPMLGAANRWFALTPIAKPCAAPAHNTTRMQSKNLRAAAASATDELQEDAAGPHPSVDDVNHGRDGRCVVSLNSYGDRGRVRTPPDRIRVWMTSTMVETDAPSFP
jgi:hypothetical protein